MDWEIRGRVGLTCNAAERRTLSAFGLMSSMLDIVRAVQLSFHAYKSGVLRPSVRYISKVCNQEFSLSPGRTTTGEVFRLHPTLETSRKGGGGVQPLWHLRIRFSLRQGWVESASSVSLVPPGLDLCAGMYVLSPVDVLLRHSLLLIANYTISHAIVKEVSIRIAFLRQTDASRR